MKKSSVIVKSVMGLFNRRKKTVEKSPRIPQASAVCLQGHEAYDNGDYEAAFALYKKAADEGDPIAINALGVCYIQGKGIEKDVAKSIELYQKAAELNSLSALFNLARLYMNGQHVERDEKKAVYFYSKAAEQGYQKAQFGLAECCKNGIGMEKDIKKALYWYEKAAEQGNVQAQKETANIYTGAFDETLKNVKRKAYWYEKAAEQGDAFSQYAIGDCYLRGEGVKKSLDRAKEWVILSARQNNEYGKFQLANIYAEEGDWEKYIAWLTDAATQGLGEAQCNLGVEYVTGKCMEKDLEKALYWTERARENNISQATGAIEEIKGMLEEEKYEKGLQELDSEQLLSIGQDYYQEGDYKHAIPYIEKAAQMGLPSAQAVFGTWYAKGIDTEGQEIEADLEKAQYWMEKAAAQGVSNAQEALSDIIRVKAVNIYNEGIAKIKERVVEPTLGITVEDFSEAQRYLEEAGELGLVEAQVVLASHYLYGDCRCIPKLRSRGIEAMWTDEAIGKDELKYGLGMYWLKKAVEQENANAMFIYAKCLLWGPKNIDLHMLFETGNEDGSKYQNTKEAFDMAVRASDLGCSEAADWLSKAEKNRYPGAAEALRRTKSYQEWEEKERKRKEWWDKEGGRLEELFHAGQEYFEKKEYEKAIPYLKEAAEGGHKDAQRQLASCYTDGFGVEKDEEKSTYWFFKFLDME